MALRGLKITWVFAFINIGIALWILYQVTPTVGPLIRVSDDGEDLSEIDKRSYLESATILSLCCGIGLIIVAVMGCSTATCEKNIQVCFYAFIGLMVFIVGMQGTAAALAHVYSGKFAQNGEKFLRTTLVKKYVGPFNRKSTISNAWDVMQYNLGCCGVTGQNIFYQLDLWNKNWVGSETAKIPVWCCKFKPNKHASIEGIIKPRQIQDKLKDTECPVTTAESYTTGCYPVMRDIVQTYQFALFGTDTALAVLEILTVIVATLIFPGVEKDNDGVYTFNYNKMGV